jgi:proteasome assembly chaperone (PAC2) family protein
VEKALWLSIEREKGRKLRNPAMIVAVSTSIPQYRALYSQGRELANYLFLKLKFERLATFNSSASPPEVIIREDGTATLPACHVDVTRAKRDILLFSGDASPMDDQYQYSRALLEYARELRVKELYSIGVRWAENPSTTESDPVTNGFATDKAGAAKLQKFGLKLIIEEPAPFFASMVVGLAPEYGIRGYKISVDHGEPSPHPKSVARMLQALSSLTGLVVPVDELLVKTLPPVVQRQTGDSTIYQ